MCPPSWVLAVKTMRLVMGGPDASVDVQDTVSVLAVLALYLDDVGHELGSRACSEDDAVLEGILGRPRGRMTSTTPTAAGAFLDSLC